MRKLQATKSTGFTLIEIVFVLAISGLIIVGIFLALPQGKVAAHDAVRKTYLQQVASSVEKYKESQANGFQYPPDAATFTAQFDPAIPGPYAVTNNDKDPLNGNLYSFGGVATPAGTTPAGIGYVLGSNCAGTAGSGLYSLTIGLEGGNTYCLDNH